MVKKIKKLKVKVGREQKVPRPAASVSSGKGQILRGRIVSAKMPKTVTVLVEREKIHPFYQKAFRRNKKYLVDDPLGVNVGDVVDIKKIRPVSKNKHFQIVSVLGRDITAVVEEELKEKTAQAIAEVMPEPSDAQASEGKEKIKSKKEKLAPKP